MGDFDRDVTGIGALADPVRRELYQFVCSQSGPVSRDQAAAAVGVARHQAKFHLDRLEAEGLLETDYVRLTGRAGPGAGRPAKRYRRSPTEVSVALPPRDYELVGQIMADAITDSARTGAPITEALTKAATAHGTAIAAADDQANSAEDGINRAAALLRAHGYEPRRLDQAVFLANCPFHALANSHTELVCQINHALIAALAQTLAPDKLNTRLDPGPDRCCVTLSAKN